jgi:hypothetical protein
MFINSHLKQAELNVKSTVSLAEDRLAYGIFPAIHVKVSSMSAAIDCPVRFRPEWNPLHFAALQPQAVLQDYCETKPEMSLVLRLWIRRGIK